MPKKRRKKKKRTSYDYDEIDKQTRSQVEGSSERKGYSGSSIFKTGQNITFYNPAVDEDHTIDIVPFIAGKNMPIDTEKKKVMVKKGKWAYTYEYWRHRGVGPLGSDTVICPERTYMKPCPICEHRRELIAEKAFDKEKHQGLYAKQRNLYNVICYDSDKEEEKGVQLMDIAHFYFEKHISKLAKKAIHRRGRGRNKRKLKGVEPFRNFANPGENGVTIEFSIEGKKGENDFDSWIGHQLIARDYEIEEEYLDAALILDQIVVVLSYEELYQLYYDEPYPGDDDEEEDEYEEPEEEEDDEDEYEEPEEEDDEEEDEEEEERVTRRRKKKRGGKKRRKKKKKLECPEGGVFGEDYEEYDECDDCELWEKCEAKSNEEFEED